MKLNGLARAGRNAADGYRSSKTTLSASLGVKPVHHAEESLARAGHAVGREDDLVERGRHVVGGHRLAVHESGILAQPERIDGAVTGGLGHLESQIAHKIVRRSRIMRVDPDQGAVERARSGESGQRCSPDGRRSWAARRARRRSEFRRKRVTPHPHRSRPRPAAGRSGTR